MLCVLAQRLLMLRSGRRDPHHRHRLTCIHDLLAPCRWHARQRSCGRSCRLLDQICMLTSDACGRRPPSREKWQSLASSEGCTKSSARL